jgi:peptidoglycan/xylan/chitin deacetylase (PgdA/CDA1 family)
LTEDKLGWIADPDDLHDEEPTTSACVDEWTIALTFDDGPTPEVTDRLLDILANKSVKATFFVVGSRIETVANGALIVKRTSESGHLVSHHSHSHKHLVFMNNHDIREELGQTTRLIADACSSSSRYFRPPFGEANRRVTKLSNELGTCVGGGCLANLFLSPSLALRIPSDRLELGHKRLALCQYG